MRNPRILVLDRNEALTEQLERVVDDLRPRPEVHTVTRVGAVGDLLTDEGPFDLLVAGPSLATRSGLARLEVIHDELPGMHLMLAFSRRPDAALRDIVRTGAVGIRLAELHAGIAVEDGRVVVVAERADILGVTVPSPPVRIPLPLPPLPGGTTPTSLVVRDGSITIGLRVPRVDEPLTPELLRNLSAATMRQDRRSVLTG